MLLPMEQFSIFFPKSWYVSIGNFINGKIKQKWSNNILARTCSSSWFVFLLNGEHSDCCTRTRWQTYNKEQIYSSVCCLCLILQSIPVVISLASSVYDLTAQSGLLVVSPHVLGRAGWGVGKQGAGEALVVGGRVVAWQTVVFEYLGPKHSRTITNIKCYWLTYSMRDARLFMAIYSILTHKCRCKCLQCRRCSLPEWPCMDCLERRRLRTPCFPYRRCTSGRTIGVYTNYSSLGSIVFIRPQWMGMPCPGQCRGRTLGLRPGEPPRARRRVWWRTPLWIMIT